MIAPKVKVFGSPQELAQAGAQHVVDAARDAIDRCGSFTLTLSGGSTPKALHTLLASGLYRDQTDWSRVEVFFGDERTVPPDHPDSNYRMASETLLSKVSIPPQKIHRMRGEIDPNEAAREYGQLLKQRFGDDGGPDLILLGIGDDGHTASLFPHTAALAEQKHRCVANVVSKLKTTRLTMTAPFINRAREIVILAAGASKAPVLREVLKGPADPQRFPIQMIQPIRGDLIFYLDSDAAGMHDDVAR